MKTEHSGAKNGGGHWGKREEAKRFSRKKRRSQSKKQVRLNPDELDGQSILDND